MARTLSILVLIASVCVLTNCGKKAEERAIEKRIEKQSGGKVKADLSKGQITIKDKEGETVIAQGGGAKVPDGFPKDVLVYKNAAVTASVKQKNMFMLSLAAKDDMNKIAEAYKSSMKSQGWEEGMVMNMPDAVALQYKKGKRNASISINKEGDKAAIVLHVETEEE